MKNKATLYSLLLIISSILSGCYSNALQYNDSTKTVYTASGLYNMIITDSAENCVYHIYKQRRAARHACFSLSDSATSFAITKYNTRTKISTAIKGGLSLQPKKQYLISNNTNGDVSCNYYNFLTGPHGEIAALKEIHGQ